MGNNKRYTLTHFILDLACSFDLETSKLVAKTYQGWFVVDEELHKNRSPNPYEFSSDTPLDSYGVGPIPVFEVTIEMLHSEGPDDLGCHPPIFFELRIRGDFTRDDNWMDIFYLRGSAGFNTMREAVAYLFSYQTSNKERNSGFEDIHPDHIFTENPPSYMDIKASRYVDLPHAIAMNQDNEKI